jgi:hypothetical protein
MRLVQLLRNPTMTAAREPVAFIVWHREQKPRARWRKVGAFATRAEALACCDGPTD